MFTTPALVLPRTAPCEEPINTELPENENTYDAFADDVIDPEDSAPEIEMPFQTPRGPAVRAPIFAVERPRQERRRPTRGSGGQVAEEPPVADVATDSDENPFDALMKRFGK